MKKILLACALSACTSAASAVEPGTWTPVPQQEAVEFHPVGAPKFAKPSPVFVPVEDMDKAFPRKLTDNLDARTVVQIIILVLAADNLPQKPTRRAAEPAQ